LKSRGYSEAEIGIHAGLADTSLMLAIDPRMVRAIYATGAGQKRFAGVTGDPRRASAELGQLAVDAIIAQSVAAIRYAARSPVTGFAARGPSAKTVDPIESSGAFVTVIHRSPSPQRSALPAACAVRHGLCADARQGAGCSSIADRPTVPECRPWRTPATHSETRRPR
jgi:hypothetical protein